jgi:hypothetical protein
VIVHSYSLWEVLTVEINVIHTYVSVQPTIGVIVRHNDLAVCPTLIHECNLQ